MFISGLLLLTTSVARAVDGLAPVQSPAQEILKLTGDVHARFVWSRLARPGLDEKAEGEAQFMALDTAEGKERSRPSRSIHTSTS